MAIPAQVEEAGELAEQLHAQMFQQQQPEEGDLPDDSGPNPEPDQDLEDVPNDEDFEDPRWESRYKSLKGKYDKEVPRLSQELREIKEEMFLKLQETLSEVRKPQTAQPVQDASTENPQDEIFEQFAETYGEDFTDNIRKLIALEAKKLTGTVEEKVNSLEDNQYKVAQNNFINYVDEQLKDTKVDWRACWDGKDPQFLEFLKQPDPSGLYTYGDLAKMYNDNWDADKLARIFKVYEETSVTPAATPRTIKQPNPAKDAVIAPSRTNTHSTPNTDSKRVWTQDMIQEFQTNDRRGKYSPDESKAMWEDLLAALGENRIR